MRIQFFNRLFLVLLVCGVSFVRVASAQEPSYNGTLSVISSNGVNTVSWTDSPFFSTVLQVTTNLSSAGTWMNLATDEEFVWMNSLPSSGGYALFVTNRSFSVPAASSPQVFFRLSTLKPIPACSFAIFYNGTLEFSYCPPMVFNGRVHANGPIYVGTIADLIFNAPVSTTTILAAPLLDGATTSDWLPSNPNTWNTTFNGGYITNTPGLYFAAPVYYPTNYHFMIDMPTSSQTGLNANASTNALMLYNQAQMILIVTNSPSGTNPAVWLTLQAAYNNQVPGSDPVPEILYYTNASPAFLNTNLPFLSLTNLTYDQRENKTNLFTQIDVGRFSTWVSTNALVQGKLPAAAGVYPTILYVADRRNYNSHQLPSVRLVNAAQLPANNGIGFSVATPNPLYVWGHYNIQTSAGSSTGTHNTYEVPAALFSDALTLLSPHWTDSEGYFTFTPGNSIFNASTMTVNAAIVTGTVPSADTSSSTTTFSGGVHNLPRLLEDWTSVNLYLNTSIIRLWDSQAATNQWKYQGNYYLPPNRFFSFDQNFLNLAKIPPGIPMFD
jgi:hypothetical protein